jgi:hypothetical protein
MIFFAVAAPTPGKLSKSFALAVFKSTLAAFVEPVVFVDEVFVLVWAAETLEPVIPHASTAANKQRKSVLRDVLT